MKSWTDFFSFSKKTSQTVDHKIMKKVSLMLPDLLVDHSDFLNQQDLTLRLATQSDLETFVNLEDRGYNGFRAWTLKDFEKEWRHNPQILYLVLQNQNEEIIGVITGRCYLKSSHISQLIIDPIWQGRGLGSCLLKVWLDLSRNLGRDSVTLEVRESNFRAQRMYFQAGFVHEETKTFYYEDNGESAWFLRCDLRGVQ